METNGEIINFLGLNEEGFLSEESGWSQRVAEELARTNDIWPLTDDHWNIIKFVRDYYKMFGQGPAIYKIHQATGLSSNHICELFPCGIVRGAYRIAGLPRPPGCI